MTFLAPAWLLLAALAGVVLILNARRRRLIDVASIRIWQTIQGAPVRRRKLQWPKPTRLLLLQLAVVLVAALALAQPRWGDPRALPNHTVFVLDLSASMRTGDVAPDRFEAARADLQQRVAQAFADGRGTISLIAAGASAELVFARQERTAGLHERIAGLQVTDGATDWDAVWRWLDALRLPGEITDLIVLTDATDASAALPTADANLRVEAVVFGTQAAGNAGVTAAVRRTGTASWELIGQVSWSGGIAHPSALAVYYTPNDSGAEEHFDDLPLSGPVQTDPATGVQRIAFTQTVEPPGPGRLRVALPADAAPQDDQAFFVLADAAGPAKVLLIGPQDAELIRALQAWGPVDITSANTLHADDASYDLVIVNNVSIQRKPQTNTLWLGRARLLTDPPPQPLATSYITMWLDDHPVSRNVAWAALSVARFYPPATPLAGTVLVEADGFPLLVAGTTSAGRELRLTADPALSGWTREAGFPLLIAGWLDWLGLPDSSAAVVCIAGEPCALAPREIGATITGPDGAVAYRGPQEEGLLPTGADATFVPARAGFYRLEAAGSSRWLAVQPGHDAQLPGAWPAAAMPPAYAAASVWWWLALAGLLFLAVEGWLAGRGGERFLVPAALAHGVPHASRRRTLLALRGLALASLVAALTAAPWPQRTPETARVSILAFAPPTLDDAARLEWLRRLQGTGLLVQAVPTARLATAETFAAWTPATGTADLQAALQLALALLPADRPGELVLAADGHADAALGAMLAPLLARGVSLDLLPATPIAGELAISRAEAPAQVHLGDVYPLRVFIYSDVARDAELNVSRNGESVASYAVALQAGNNLIETSLRADQAGTALLAARITAPDDPDAGNNEVGAVVQVQPAPSLLILSPDRVWGAYFGDLLRAQGMTVRVVLPVEAPQTIEQWLQYDLAILMNTPALALATAQQQQLEEAVRVHGLGLLILGGENAFGPGGYYETPLESLSPLSARVYHESPLVAIAFVLDRSASMQLLVNDMNRLDLTKIAAYNAVRLLHEESSVAIVVFDYESHVILPLQRKDDAAVAEALAPLVPIGGTFLYPGLWDAVTQLQGATEAVKHIVVMTDGAIERDVNFASLVRRATDAGITISGISIGVSASPQLEEIVRLGGGTYHVTRDFQALPSILAREALSLTNPAVVERLTQVFRVDRSTPFLAGLPDALPPVANFVATTLKPGATLHLELLDDREETVPLMASWRYGSGRVLAFTSHAAGSGAQYWMDMPQYAQLWTQTVRQFLSSALGPGLHLTLEPRGDRQVTVTADLLDARGQPRTGQTVVVRESSAAAGTGQPLVEQQPGRYSAVLDVPGPGTYRFTAQAGSTQTQGTVQIDYPARLDPGRVDWQDLETLARLTGGVRYADAAGAPAMKNRWIVGSLWQPWMLFALFLFLVDLFLRYGGDWWRRRGQSQK